MSDSRQQRKKRYEQILRTVAYQSSPMQIPGCQPGRALMIVSDHGSLNADAAAKALRAAVQNDDLLAWTHPDYQTHSTLPKAHTHVTLATDIHMQPAKPHLRRLAQYLAEDLGDTEQLGTVNRTIQQLRDDDD